MKNRNELKVVSIRLVDAPPLLSSKELASPKDVIELLGEELEKYDREYFCVLNLRTNNQVINMNIVSMGTLNAALVHPREVFKSAVLANAASIILLHNHPSGKCSPSQEDCCITRKLIEAGAIMGIPVLDHVIVSGKQYYSFKEHDMIIEAQTEQEVNLVEPSKPKFR